MLLPNYIKHASVFICTNKDRLPKQNTKLSRRFDCLQGQIQASQVTLVVQNPPTSAGDIRDSGYIPGSGRSAGGGRGNPHQYSCLQNSHGQRSLAKSLHKIAKSRTQLKRLSMHTYMQGQIRESSVLWKELYVVP